MGLGLGLGLVGEVVLVPADEQTDHGVDDPRQEEAGDHLVRIRVRVRVRVRVRARVRVRVRVRVRARARVRVRASGTVFDEIESPPLTMPPGSAHSPVSLRLMASTCDGDSPHG